jgi:uncharacterized protein YqjF (DUF2071 family)
LAGQDVPGGDQDLAGDGGLGRVLAGALGEVAVELAPRAARQPWIMGQSPVDLLFAHWAVPASALRTAVPAGIPIDTFQGAAWVGITPFEVVGARPRGVPPLPWLSRFLELNVRTYTTIDGRPAFGSSASTRQAPPSSPARASRTSCPTASPRWALPAPAAASPTAAAPAPRAPSCAWPTSPRDRRPTRRPARSEHFLTERYCLYTVDRDDRLRRADIHHAPWPLQPARADLAENTMTAALGIRLPNEEQLVHFAARQDVLVWPLASATPGLRSRRLRREA